MLELAQAKSQSMTDRLYSRFFLNNIQANGFHAQFPGFFNNMINFLLYDPVISQAFLYS